MSYSIFFLVPQSVPFLVTLEIDGWAEHMSGLHNASGNGDTWNPICQLFLRWWRAGFCKLVVYGMEGIPRYVLVEEWEAWACLESQGLESLQLSVAAKFISTTELLTAALKSYVSIMFWQMLLVTWLGIILHFSLIPLILTSSAPSVTWKLPWPSVSEQGVWYFPWHL